LAPSGIACTVLGLILTFWRGPVRFQTIALLIVLMAVGIGLYEFAAARVRRPGHQTARWLPAVHGLVTAAFVCAFLASGFDWIQWMRASPAPTINLLGCFFAFSAISMLGLSRMQRTEP
jgi:hypothetical protein